MIRRRELRGAGEGAPAAAAAASDASASPAAAAQASFAPPALPPPGSVPGVASLKLSHATPVSLPPGLAAALFAARTLLPASSPLALIGTPFPGCTLLVLDAFDAGGEAGGEGSGGNGGGSGGGGGAATTTSAGVALQRLLSGDTPAACFLRSQPLLRFEDGRGGVATAALGRIRAAGYEPAAPWSRDTLRLAPLSCLALVPPPTPRHGPPPALRLLDGARPPEGALSRLQRGSAGACCRSENSSPYRPHSSQGCAAG